MPVRNCEEDHFGEELHGGLKGVILSPETVVSETVVVKVNRGCSQ